MVSKASDDLPLPDRPVMTISASRGRSTSTPLRLCSRAPRTEIWVRLMGGVCSRFVLGAQERFAPVHRINRRSGAPPQCGRFPPTSQRLRQASGRWLAPLVRSEEHTSELQSLMRISYAVFCLQKKKHYRKDI